MTDPDQVPPPPPPPAIAASGEGFGMSGNRMGVEVVVAIVALVGLGWGVLAGAGTLAAWLTPYVPPAVDVAIGEQASKLGQMGQLCENPEAQAYVERLAQPMLDQIEDSPFEFSFVVSKTDQVNAFALPGGFVTVNYGLLTTADTGEEVAAVIAHELQHVLQRHGTRRVLRQLGGWAVLSALVGGTDLAVPTFALAELTDLSYDRGEESEADVLGLELLGRAGIDPIGMATFFDRLDKLNKIRGLELYSTHPDPGDRSERARIAAKKLGKGKPLPSPQGIECNNPTDPSDSTEDDNSKSEDTPEPWKPRPHPDLED